MHSGKPPALILNLADHSEIPDSIGTRRGREEDSAEREGEGREREVQTKRESPCPDVSSGGQPRTASYCSITSEKR